jgi:mediator of RNA polymerase II transcription subunit 14
VAQNSTYGAIMNGERPVVNGQHLLNGVTSTQHHQAAEAKISRIQQPSPALKSSVEQHSHPYENGVLVNGPVTPQPSGMPNGLEQAPPELLQLVGREHYLPMSTMIARTAQNCWNDLFALVDQLSTQPVSQQSSDPSRPIYGIVNNQSKTNLDKKDRILNFAETQKAIFIKLLVLLQWGKNSDDVSKTVNLNYWLQNQRNLFFRVRDALAELKQEALNYQVPNPDLATAGKTLSLEKATGCPDIGYSHRKPLKRKQILATVRRLSRTVTVRLALEDSLPPRLRSYHIHDGRATFHVANEFEVDLSVLDESPTALFRVVDFRFAFSPSPHIPDTRRSEIEFIANSVIDNEGLLGCYNFFHNLALTSQLAEYYNQALQLSRNQWAGYLRIEFLRRDLVVEYWRNATQKKSWIEISIHSGRDDLEDGDNPHLQLRWFVDGKQIKDFEVEMDPAHLSFESVLLQILSQHANRILNSVYDRLTLSEIYKEDSMAVEQSSSDFDPKHCSIDLQLSQSSHISVSVDSISGSIVVGPASDRARRLQAELNAARVRGDDMVPRLLNYRCVLSEGRILRALQDTDWTRLDAVRPNMAEIRNLFGTSLTRVNFYRHNLWDHQYMMAFSTNFSGDKLWILRKARESNTLILGDLRVLHEQSLDIKTKVSPSFFDHFDDYASGLVVLHSNATKLQQSSSMYRLPKMPDFRDHDQLPALVFEAVQKAASVANDGSGVADKQPSDSAVAREVRLVFKELNQASKKAYVSVELRCNMEPAVLESLSKSNPDDTLTFAPEKKTIWIELSTIVGRTVIDEIITRVARLNDLIACIRMVKNLSNVTLKSASMHSLDIAFYSEQEQEFQLTVGFPSAKEAARLEFGSSGTDPHESLVPQLSALLADRRHSFCANLRDALLSLHLTQPLVLALHELEHRNPGADKTDTANVRVHFIVRTPTMFALQFFSQTRVPTEKPTPLQHERMLARFEILPSPRETGQWLIRPAIEEVNTYTRPPFAAQSLQNRIRDEIFKKEGDCPDWLRLDGAAIFLKDNPAPLLNALYALVSDWTKSNPTSTSALPTAAPTEAKAPSQQGPAPPQKATNTNPNTNAANRKPSGPQKAQANAANQRAKNQINRPAQQQQAAKKQEVITLE